MLKAWFFAYPELDRTIELAKRIEELNYDYMLLPFNSEMPDPLSKSLIMFANTEKIGCWVALPGYAAHPTYINMIYKTIHEAFPNRKLSLNIIDGGLQEDPTKFGIGKNKKLIKELNKIFSKKIKALDSNIDLVFSGSSLQTVETANIYGSLQLIMLKDLELINSYSLNHKNIIVRMWICARETDELAQIDSNNILKKFEEDDYLRDYFLQRIKDNLIIGSYENVANQIKKLEEKDVHGILVSDIILSNDEENVHKAMVLV